MKPSDKKEFAKLLYILATALGEEVKGERVEVYFERLKGYEISQITAATAKLTDTCKFFPKISEFIEAVQGTMDDRASQAWYSYLEALKHPGPYKSLNIGDPYAHAAILDCKLWGRFIDELGYPDQRLTGREIRDERSDGSYYVPERRDETPFLRKEFIERYRFHQRNSDPKSLPTYLQGINEHQNRLAIASGQDKNWTPEQRGLASSTMIPLTAGAKPIPLAITDKGIRALPEAKFEEMPDDVKALIRGMDIQKNRKEWRPLTEDDLKERKVLMLRKLEE